MVGVATMAAKVISKEGFGESTKSPMIIKATLELRKPTLNMYLRRPKGQQRVISSEDFCIQFVIMKETRNIMPKIDKPIIAGDRIFIQGHKNTVLGNLSHGEK